MSFINDLRIQTLAYLLTIKPLKNGVFMVFECICCKQNLRIELLRYSPICDSCFRLLVPATEGFLELTHPDLSEKNLYLDSLHACYLATGQTHKILKAWKLNPSPEFESLLLNSFVTAFLSLIKTNTIQAITYIPQTHQRSWSMKGGSSYRIAQFISLKTKIPIVETLEIQHKAAVQSELNLKQRMQNQIVFSAIKKDQHLQRILLIDDWMTTGKTLQSGAFTLRLNGLSHVHGLVLGIRPKKNLTTNLKSNRWPKTIGQQNKLIS